MTSAVTPWLEKAVKKYREEHYRNLEFEVKGSCLQITQFNGARSKHSPDHDEQDVFAFGHDKEYRCLLKFDGSAVKQFESSPGREPLAAYKGGLFQIQRFQFVLTSDYVDSPTAGNTMVEPIPGPKLRKIIIVVNAFRYISSAGDADWKTSLRPFDVLTRDWIKLIKQAEDMRRPFAGVQHPLMGQKPPDRVLRTTLNLNASPRQDPGTLQVGSAIESPKSALHSGSSRVEREGLNPRSPDFTSARTVLSRTNSEAASTGSQTSTPTPARLGSSISNVDPFRSAQARIRLSASPAPLQRGAAAIARAANQGLRPTVSAPALAMSDALRRHAQPQMAIPFQENEEEEDLYANDVFTQQFDEAAPSSDPVPPSSRHSTQPPSSPPEANGSGGSSRPKLVGAKKGKRREKTDYQKKLEELERLSKTSLIPAHTAAEDEDFDMIGSAAEEALEHLIIETERAQSFARTESAEPHDTYDPITHVTSFDVAPATSIAFPTLDARPAPPSVSPSKRKRKQRLPRYELSSQASDVDDGATSTPGKILKADGHVSAEAAVAAVAMAEMDSMELDVQEDDGDTTIDVAAWQQANINAYPPGIEDARSSEGAGTLTREVSFESHSNASRVSSDHHSDDGFEFVSFIAAPEGVRSELPVVAVKREESPELANTGAASELSSQNNAEHFPPSVLEISKDDQPVIQPRSTQPPSPSSSQAELEDALRIADEDDGRNALSWHDVHAFAERVAGQRRDSENFLVQRLREYARVCSSEVVQEVETHKGSAGAAISSAAVVVPEDEPERYVLSSEAMAVTAGKTSLVRRARKTGRREFATRPYAVRMEQAHTPAMTSEESASAPPPKKQKLKPFDQETARLIKETRAGIELHLSSTSLEKTRCVDLWFCCSGDFQVARTIALHDLSTETAANNSSGITLLPEDVKRAYNACWSFEDDEVVENGNGEIPEVRKALGDIERRRGKGAADRRRKFLKEDPLAKRCPRRVRYPYEADG